MDLWNMRSVSRQWNRDDELLCMWVLLLTNTQPSHQQIHARFIKNWVQIVLVRLSLAFVGTWAVRQQVETNVRIGRVVRVTCNQVPMYTQSTSYHIHKHTFLIQGGPKYLPTAILKIKFSKFNFLCVIFHETLCTLLKHTWNLKTEDTSV